MRKIQFTLFCAAILGNLATFSTATNVFANSNQDNFGLELHYRDSAFQCGSDSTQADIKVNVYDKNNNLLKTLSKGDTHRINNLDSASDLKFTYNIHNLTCIGEGSLRSERDSLLLGSNDATPDIDGFSGQASIAEMLVGLDTYEELYLVELGTSNTYSSAYDLQDVVIVVDNDPLSPD
ncbi:MAG: hypothetical protein AAGA80_14910 [Cyanobacteria bacterium P01_F01_bin.143]